MPNLTYLAVGAAVLGSLVWLLLRGKKSEGALEEKVTEAAEDAKAADEKAIGEANAAASVAQHLSAAEAISVLDKGGL